MKHNWTTGEAWAKGIAAIIGGPLHLFLWMVTVSAVLVRLGLPPSVAAASGVLAALPAAATFVIIALLSRTKVRAWIFVGGSALILAALASASILSL